MEIAVVGTPEFTLGFQLAGISHLHNPSTTRRWPTSSVPYSNSKEVGIVVVDSASLGRLPERLREQLSASVTPTVLGIGTEDNTLRDTIRKAIESTLWA